MRKFAFLFLAFFVFSVPSVSRGQSLQNASEVRLSNGLKVILLENHNSPAVTFQVWYRAGARHEGVGKTGLAHLLEHMMFKGTEKVSGEEFSRMIDENGGEENAFTGHDFAAYFETVSSDRIGVPIMLEADRMRNLVLRESDFNTERMVVIEERRMRVDDNPDASLHEQLDAGAYVSQPYHFPVIGWTEDLERITLEDVQSFYNTYYVPANAFIVVVGDFSRESLVPELEKAFGNIPPGTAQPAYSIQDPPQPGERRIVVERPARLATLAAGYHVPNLRLPDSYVLEVIRAVLSSGKSSRLYNRVVRGKGLALDASAYYSPVSQDPSLFYVSASVLPEKNMAEVETALYEELEQLKTVPVDALELEKAKNQLEASFVFDQDSIFSLGMQLAEYEIAFDWRAIGNYVPSIRSVTPEEIQRVAAKYFTSDNRTVGTLVPTGEPEEEPSKPSAPPPEGMRKVIR